jgi:hypothetical protein
VILRKDPPFVVLFVAVGDAAPDAEVVHFVCVVLDAAPVPDAFAPNCCGSKNVSISGFELISLPWLTMVTLM